MPARISEVHCPNKSFSNCKSKKPFFIEDAERCSYLDIAVSAYNGGKNFYCTNKNIVE